MSGRTVFLRVTPLASIAAAVVLTAAVLPSLPTANPYVAHANGNGSGPGAGASANGSPSPGASLSPGAPGSSANPLGTATGPGGVLGPGGTSGAACANGGATYSQGVSCTAIDTVFHWHTTICGQDVSAALAEIGVGKGDPQTTLDLLVPYFNQHAAQIYPDFANRLLGQKAFYGRSIHAIYEPEDGGSFCPDQNHAAATKFARTDRAFAALGGCLTCGSEGSTDVIDPDLASYHVMSIAWGNNRAAWYDQLQPYTWSIAASGDTIINQWVSLVCDYLKNRPPTVDSDRPVNGDAVNAPRRFSISHVNYQEENALAAEFMQRIKDCGAQTGIDFAYDKDLSTASTQAATYDSRMRQAKTTTVFALADPVATLIGGQADSQSHWEHETVFSDFSLGDNDTTPETYAKDQQQNAFATAQLYAHQLTETKFCDIWYGRIWCDHVGRNSAGRPNVQPPSDFGIWAEELFLYGRMLLESGPTLTPQNVERGMFASCAPCPRPWAADWTLPGFGPRYPDGPFNAPKDYALVRWDPNQFSDDAAVTSTGSNPGQGAWVPIGRSTSADGGKPPPFGDLASWGWTRFRDWAQPS